MNFAETGEEGCEDESGEEGDGGEGCELDGVSEAGICVWDGKGGRPGSWGTSEDMSALEGRREAQVCV